MKKIIILSFVLVGLVFTGFAQKHGSKEQISAYRKVQSIESKIVHENTDAEAVELIKAHRTAKKQMEKKMQVMNGYGKAAKDKIALNKFRVKCEKDPKFSVLSSAENETRKAKETYLNSIDEDYKRLLPTAYPSK